jgi:hypothetical protein
MSPHYTAGAIVLNTRTPDRSPLGELRCYEGGFLPGANTLYVLGHMPKGQVAGEPDSEGSESGMLTNLLKVHLDGSEPEMMLSGVKAYVLSVGSKWIAALRANGDLALVPTRGGEARTIAVPEGCKLVGVLTRGDDLLWATTASVRSRSEPSAPGQVYASSLAGESLEPRPVCRFATSGMSRLALLDIADGKALVAWRGATWWIVKQIDIASGNVRRFRDVSWRYRSATDRKFTPDDVASDGRDLP